MNDIRRIVDNLDIVKLISETVSLKKAGVNYQGLCPFHAEDTPSFVVSPKKNIFKCFGCNVSGDALTFYMKRENISFMEAMIALGKQMGIEIHGHKETKQNKGALDILKAVSQHYLENIFSMEGQTALKYLTEERKFSEQLIKEHYLGYSTGDLPKFLKEKGYSIQEATKLGLIKNGYEVFKNRVMFSIVNMSGDVIGFGGRGLNNQVIPKYINSSESEIFHKGSNLYGIFNKKEIKDKDYAILVEGYTDVLALRSVGIYNGVASLGTALTEKQAELLKRLTPNIVLMYDNDKAGILATERAIYILKKVGCSVKVCQLKYKDPDEFLRNDTVQNLKVSIKNSQECLDFLLEIYSKKNGDVLDKKEVVNKFKEFFLHLPTSLDVEIYLEKLSIQLGIPKDVLSSYIYNSKGYSNKQSYTHNQNSKDEYSRQKDKEEYVPNREQYAKTDTKQYGNTKREYSKEDKANRYRKGYIYGALDNKIDIDRTKQTKKVLNDLELDTLGLVLNKRECLNILRDNEYIQSSKISFLMFSNLESLESDIQLFLESLGYDIKDITKKHIDNFTEFEKNVVTCWKNKEINDQLKEIEHLSKDRDKMDTLKQYYNKKKEKEKLNG